MFDSKKSNLSPSKSLMASYLSLYIATTFRVSSFKSAAVPPGLFIRQVSAELVVPAKPDTAYGNAPRPDREGCTRGGEPTG